MILIVRTVLPPEFKEKDRRDERVATIQEFPDIGSRGSCSGLCGSGGQWARLRTEDNFRSAPTLPCALSKDQHGRTWRADLLFATWPI
jgi:hypothetical protein